MPSQKVGTPSASALQPDSTRSIQRAGLERADDGDRNAEDQPTSDREQTELQGGRQALADQVEHRLAAVDRQPEIAGQRASSASRSTAPASADRGRTGRWRPRSAPGVAFSPTHHRRPGRPAPRRSWPRCRARRAAAPAAAAPGGGARSRSWRGAAHGRTRPRVDALACRSSSTLASARPMRVEATGSSASARGRAAPHRSAPRADRTCRCAASRPSSASAAGCRRRGRQAPPRAGSPPRTAPRPAPGSGSRHWAARCGTCCRSAEPPNASTAVTKSRLRSDSTWARVMRAKLGMPVMPTATSAAIWLRPSTAIIAMANRMPGSASSTSTKRISTASRQPPKKPATRPIGTPIGAGDDDRARRREQRGARAVDRHGPGCRGRVRRCRTNARPTGRSQRRRRGPASSGSSGSRSRRSRQQRSRRRGTASAEQRARCARAAAPTAPTTGAAPSSDARDRGARVPRRRHRAVRRWWQATRRRQPG